MAKSVEVIETKPGRVMVVARSLADKPGVAGRLFTRLGQAELNVEMITESGVSGDRVDISFALEESQVEEAVRVLKGLKDPRVEDFTVATGRGILTVYGKKLTHQPGIAGKIFSILAEEGVNIDMISTSFSSISVLIKESYLTPAKNLVSRELGVDA